MSTLTWRTYRDPARAPVPIARRRVHKDIYRIVPASNQTGDTIHVVPFIRAWGLYSGTEWTGGSSFPAATMAAEPILTQLHNSYGGMSYKLAVPESFSGTGPNPYNDPRIVVVGEEARVMIPGRVLDTTSSATRAYGGVALGRSCYRIPAGFADLQYVTVGGAAYGSLFDYDPYHGVVFLSETGSGQAVSVVVNERFVMHRGIPQRISGAMPFYEAGALIGHITRTRRGGWEDARRLPPRAPGGRLDSMYFDGEPVSTGHLWIIETTADSERLARAVRRSMPAGTLYRQTTTTYVPDRVLLVYPVSGITSAAPIDFEWEAFDEAVHYQIQVSRTAQFSELEVDASGLAVTTYTTSALTPSVTLYWRVRAYDGLAMTAWSQVGQFTASGTTAPGTVAVRVSDGAGGFTQLRTSASEDVHVQRG